WGEGELCCGADVSDILHAAADRDAERPLELDRVGDDDGFSADLDFVSPHASAQEPTASSTRDVLEGARAPMTPEEDAAPRQAFGLAKRGGQSKMQGRLDKQAGRQSSTMPTALASLGAARGARAGGALGVVAGDGTLQVVGGSGLRRPGGPALAPTPTTGAAPAATAVPMAAVALGGSPADAVPSPDAAATEGAGLF